MTVKNKGGNYICQKWSKIVNIQKWRTQKSAPFDLYAGEDDLFVVLQFVVVEHAVLHKLNELF